MASAYAAVGYVVRGYAALSSVNVGGLRGTLVLSQVVVLGVLAGVLVFAGLWIADRRAHA